MNVSKTQIRSLKESAFENWNLVHPSCQAPIWGAISWPEQPINVFSVLDESRKRLPATPRTKKKQLRAKNKSRVDAVLSELEDIFASEGGKMNNTEALFASFSERVLLLQSLCMGSTPGTLMKFTSTHKCTCFITLQWPKWSVVWGPKYT